MNNTSKWNTSLKKMTGLVPASFYRAAYPRDFYIFFYHLISDQSLPHVKHLYAYKTPAMFENDLKYLLNHHPLPPYERLVKHLQGGMRLESNSVFLTFDDGFSECFSVVRPLLLKYQVPCTFFITTDLMDNQKLDNSTLVSLIIEKMGTHDREWKEKAFRNLSTVGGGTIEHEAAFINWMKTIQFTDRTLIDRVCDTLEVDPIEYLMIQKPYMSKTEIGTLAAEGFTIGAHSKSHALFYQLSEKEIEHEIVESCRIIQEITNADQVPFAFPVHGNGLSRKMLSEIQARNKVVGQLFDTNGIRQSQGEVIDRIWADAPVVDEEGKSNLPELVKRAYQELVLDWFRKYKRFLFHKES